MVDAIEAIPLAEAALPAVGRSLRARRYDRARRADGRNLIHAAMTGSIGK